MRIPSSFGQRAAAASILFSGGRRAQGKSWLFWQMVWKMAEQREEQARRRRLEGHRAIAKACQEFLAGFKR